MQRTGKNCPTCTGIAGMRSTVVGVCKRAKISTRLGCALLGMLFSAVNLQAQVQRSDVIAMAQAYSKFTWTPTSANAFHGVDASGIHVDTPDIGFQREGIRGGWWIPDRKNVGVPYMWGGFSTLEEFAEGIRDGKPAGDVCTIVKREKLDAAVSQSAVGIDCSGLVSRCWKLDRSYSTREITELCTPLDSYEELKPGDILNCANKHVLIFWKFKNPEWILAYGAGSPPTWKVALSQCYVPMLKQLGYKPYRYKEISD